MILRDQVEFHVVPDQTRKLLAKSSIMAQALREPFALVSRRISSPPRARILPANSPAKRQNTTTASSSASKLVAALDAFYTNLSADVIEPAIDIRHELGSSTYEDKNVRKGKKKPTNHPNTMKEPTLQPYVQCFFCTMVSDTICNFESTASILSFVPRHPWKKTMHYLLPERPRPRTLAYRRPVVGPSLIALSLPL